MPVEISKTDEILHEVELGSLLVPISMRLLMCDEMEKFANWGKDIHWMRHALNAISRYAPEDLMSVLRVVDEGMDKVRGNGNGKLEHLVNLTDHRRDPERHVRWGRYIVGLAVKSTIYVAGGRQEYIENLEAVKAISEYPEVVDELLNQMGIEISRTERIKLIELLEKIL